MTPIKVSQQCSFEISTPNNNSKTSLSNECIASEPITCIVAWASLSKIDPILLFEMLNAVVGLITNLQKHSKNNLIEVEKLTYSGISKGRKQNSG